MSSTVGNTSISITDPAGILGGIKWADTYAKALFDGADELGQIEQFNVTSRTPVLTGALAADVSYEVGPFSDNVIVTVKTDTTNQLDEYGRVYALYIEGGTLGLGSNNGTGDVMMYGQITSTDIPAVQQWGQEQLEKAHALILAGKALRP